MGACWQLGFAWNILILLRGQFNVYWFSKCVWQINWCSSFDVVTFFFLFHLFSSIAASAPILQLPGLYSCEKFNLIVSQDFRSYSEDCFQSIKRSWSVIDRLASTQNGLDWLTHTFRLCEPLTKKNLSNFLDWFSDIYGALAMTDYPNPATFLAPLPAYPIKVFWILII